MNYIKNIIQGLIISGLFIIFTPIAISFCIHLFDAFVGFGPTYRRDDIATFYTLFSIPLGIAFSIFGLILNIIFSFISPDFKNLVTDLRKVVFFVILFFIITIPFLSYLFILK